MCVGSSVIVSAALFRDPEGSFPNFLITKKEKVDITMQFTNTLFQNFIFNLFDNLKVSTDNPFC